MRRKFFANSNYEQLLIALFEINSNKFQSYFNFNNLKSPFLIPAPVHVPVLSRLALRRTFFKSTKKELKSIKSIYLIKMTNGFVKLASLN